MIWTIVLKSRIIICLHISLIDIDELDYLDKFRNTYIYFKLKNMIENESISNFVNY